MTRSELPAIANQQNTTPQHIENQCKYIYIPNETQIDQKICPAINVAA